MQPGRWLTRRVLAVLSGALVAAILLVFALRLPWWQSLLLLFVVACGAEMLGIWLEGRAQARRTGTAQARRTGTAPAGILKMVGMNGVAVTECAPDGRVRIGLEEWACRSETGARIEPGTPVLVVGSDDRRISVAALQGAASRTQPAG